MRPLSATEGAHLGSARGVRGAIKFVYAALAAAMACALVAAVSFTPAARRRWLMVTVLPICSVYFSTGRSNFVTGVAMAGLVYVVARPMRPSLRQAAAAGLAAAVLFVLTLFVGGAIIGKTYEASELATIDTVFSRTPELQPLALPYQYASAPIASLNELVASVGPWGATSGCATLAPGCRLFATVGLPLEQGAPHPGVHGPAFALEHLYRSRRTGTRRRAGLAVLLVALLGALTGLAWRLGTKGTPIFVVAFGILGTAAVSSVIQNNFLAYHYLGAILLFALAWLAGETGECPRNPQKRPLGCALWHHLSKTGLVLVVRGRSSAAVAPTTTWRRRWLNARSSNAPRSLSEVLISESDISQVPRVSCAPRFSRLLAPLATPSAA